MAYFHPRKAEILEDYRPISSDSFSMIVSNGEMVIITDHLTHEDGNYWQIRHGTCEKGYIPDSVSIKVIDTELCLRLKTVVPTISTTYYQVADCTMIYVDHYWNDRFRRTKIILAFVMAALSALINIIFASLNVLELKRDTKLNYNLTEYVLVYFEAIVIYIGLFMAISGIPSFGYPLRIALTGLHLMRMNVLFFIRFWMYGRSMRQLEAYIRWSRTTPSLIRRLCTGCSDQSRSCGARVIYVLRIVLIIAQLVSVPLLCVSPLLGATGLLMRLRQFAWVNNLYVIDWSYVEWFKLLGFVNNIASLTAANTAHLAPIQRLLTGLYDVENGKIELTKRKRNEFFLMSQNITETIHLVKGKMIALLLSHSWREDPEVFIKIMRNVDPTSCE
eukprot:252810_1